MSSSFKTVLEKLLDEQFFFRKTILAIRFNLLEVCPSLPPFVLSVLFKPSFNVLSSYRYFYVSLSLLAVLTV